MPRARINSLSAPKGTYEEAMPARARALVLAYYGDEEGGLAVKPCAGLRLDTFRVAREALVSQGLLRVDAAGRYRTVQAVKVTELVVTADPVLAQAPQEPVA